MVLTRERDAHQGRHGRGRAADRSVSEHVTVSAGVASMTADRTRPWSELLREADKALYEAKAGGRNRVVTAGSSSPETSEGPE